MAASTGALAAERARLEQEIAELSRGLPAEAASIVERADALLADHGAKIAALKARRDQIDNAFGISARDKAAAQVQARQERYEALVEALRVAEDARCAAVERIEGHAHGLRDAIIEAFAAADQERVVAKELATLARSGRPNFPAMSQPDFAQRTGGRIGGLMETLPPLYRRQLGPVNWGAEAAFYPADKTGWAERERHHFELDIESAIALGAKDAAD
jgi:hypothetical protein